MFCKKCGARIDDNSRFCSNCGALQQTDGQSDRREPNDLEDVPPLILPKGDVNRDDYISRASENRNRAESGNQNAEARPRAERTQDNRAYTERTYDNRSQTGRARDRDVRWEDRSRQIRINGEPLGKAYEEDSFGETSKLMQIFALICVVAYVVRAIMLLPSVGHGISNMLSGYRGYTLWGFFGLVTGALTVASCVLFAVMLFTIGQCTELQKAETIYLGVLAAAAMRILTAFLRLVVEFIFSRSEWLRYSVFCRPSVLAWALLGAIISVGGLYVLFTLSGFRPLIGKSKEELTEMAGDLFLLFQNPDREAGKQRTAVNSARASAAPGAAGGQTKEYYRPDYVPGDLTTDRSLLKYLIFSILTLGIYSLYFYYSIARDINIICEGDGEHTSGLLSLIVFSILTCGIYALVWEFKFADRLVDNSQRYGVTLHDGGSTVLLWRVAGAFLCCVGTFVATYIMIKNLNTMAKAYNEGKNGKSQRV